MNTMTDRRVMLTRFQDIISTRRGLVGCGDGCTVALHINGCLLYRGSDRSGQALDASARDIMSLHVRGDSVVALRTDGTVYTVGRSPAETAFAAGLACVRRVKAGRNYIAALLGNGQVVVGGEAPRTCAETAEWPAVTDIACGDGFIAGLCPDGRVLLAGGSRYMRHLVSTWTGVGGIFADECGKFLYAINDEGKMLGTVRLPARVREWRNLVFCSASGRRLCAVTVTGQLLCNFEQSPDLSDKEFVTCSVGERHAAAVTRDGWVMAWGDNRFGQCKTASFGQLFTHFDELSAHRHACAVDMLQGQTAYQRRRAEAARFGSLLSCSERLTACVTAFGRGLTTGSVGGGQVWHNIHRVSCGNAHVLALTKQGRVLAEGNATANDNRDCCHVSDWQDVRDIEAGSYHSLGVTYGGHVYYSGENIHGEGDVSDWQDIRLVRTDDTYTVGLTYDGRLRVAGLPPFDPLLLDDIDAPVTDVALAPTHMVCRLADGRAFATLPPDPLTGRTAADPAVAAWYHVDAIAAGRGLSVGLCYGGTVHISGGDPALRAEVASWRHIVSVGCGEGYVAALGVDGHLRIAGTPSPARRSHTDYIHAHIVADAPMQRPFSEAAKWQKVIAFRCGPTHLVALDRDGQVLACGSDSDGQCSATNHFTLFREAHSLDGYGQFRKTSEEHDAEMYPKNLL